MKNPEQLKSTPEEGGIEGEEAKRKLIKDATNFDELYEAIRKIGEIKSNIPDYTPEKAIELIKEIRDIHNNSSLVIGSSKSEDCLTMATKNLGLRDKVRELLENKINKEGEKTVEKRGSKDGILPEGTSKTPLKNYEEKRKKRRGFANDDDYIDFKIF